MKKATIVSRPKVSVKETLLGIPVGESREIDRKDIRFSSIRSAIYSLKKKGYDFKPSEAGRIDSVVVTRLK